MRPLDVRVITATNKNLLAEVAAGRFRTDLFYRLNTVTLTLPPLRERREDIPALAAHFIRNFNERFSRKIKGITFDALEELTGRPWSGNVRELKNAIEHAFVYCPGDVIDIKDLGPCEIALPRPLGEEKRKGDRRASTLFSNSTPLPTPVSPPPHIQSWLPIRTLTPCVKCWNSITGISDALPPPWVCTAQPCGGTCRAWG
jgi:DNA-binding NtrC family response regulator